MQFVSTSLAVFLTKASCVHGWNVRVSTFVQVLPCVSSRALKTKFSGTHGDRGVFIFPVQLTTSRIGNLTRLIHTLLYVMTIHTYIHTNEKGRFLNAWARPPGDRQKKAKDSDMHMTPYTHSLSR